MPAIIPDGSTTVHKGVATRRSAQGAGAANGPDPGQAGTIRNAAPARTVEGIKIVVLDDYQRVARGFGPFDALPDAEVEVRHEPLAGLDDLAAALRGAEVVVAMRERTPFPAEAFDRLPDLRLLVTTGMADAAVDLATAAAHGVTVSGTAMTGSARTSNTTELTWALILAVRRHLVAEDRALRDGRWQTTIGADLGGSTLGVLGLGRLGTQVARIGQAFDMPP